MPVDLPVIVADIGINHCGNMKIAKSLIALAKNMGAHYVKFQKRDVAKVYTKNALGKQKVSPWGTFKHHEKLGLEFGREEYDEIDSYCRNMGIRWFASPWDCASADFLNAYNPPYMKVPSAAVTHIDLLTHLRDLGRPVILSTGMSTPKQVATAVRILRPCLAYILHCASEYPTSDEKMNMLGFKALQKKYGKIARVGLSSHNRRLIYMAQAYAMGAKMIEFHITLDKTLPGDDQMASIGPAGFLKLMEHLEAIERGWGSGLLTPSEAELAKGRQYIWRQE